MELLLFGVVVVLMAIMAALILIGMDLCDLVRNIRTQNAILQRIKEQLVERRDT